VRNTNSVLVLQVAQFDHQLRARKSVHSQRIPISQVCVPIFLAPICPQLFSQGIGVRVAFYIQGFITILGPRQFITISCNDHSLMNYIRFSEHGDTEGTFRNAFFTSVALTISAFVYGRTPGGLSLLDGVLVTILTSLITIGGVYNARILYQGKKALKVAYFFHIITLVAFGLTVWRNVNTYGTTPGCNINSSVKFVLFGHSVSATSKGLRGFAIFSFAFTAAFIPLNAIALFNTKSTYDGDSDISDDEDFRRLDWFWTILPCSIWIYQVVTIEQIIQRNGVLKATSQWTFGQTFALVLVLGTVFDFWTAVWRRMRK